MFGVSVAKPGRKVEFQRGLLGYQLVFVGGFNQFLEVLGKRSDMEKMRRCV